MIGPLSLLSRMLIGWELDEVMGRATGCPVGWFQIEIKFQTSELE